MILYKHIYTYFTMGELGASADSLSRPKEHWLQAILG